MPAVSEFLAHTCLGTASSAIAAKAAHHRACRGSLSSAPHEAAYLARFGRGAGSGVPAASGSVCATNPSVASAVYGGKGGGYRGVACDHFKMHSEVHFGGDCCRAAPPAECLCEMWDALS